MDESLEIPTGLWSGEPFFFRGEHYTVDEMAFRPPPVQRPRVPIWVVGAWPSRKYMNRALRYDGLLAARTGGGAGEPGLVPEDVRAMRSYVEENRPQDSSFDIVCEGETLGDDPEHAASLVRPLAEAGATWWIEAPWSLPNEPEDLGRRIAEGPPRVARTVE